MTRFEFESVCHEMNLEVVQEYEDINALTVRGDGMNIADIYLDDFAHFTTCFGGFSKYSNEIKRKLVFLLAEFSTSGGNE